jgi:hypothetical protein
MRNKLLLSTILLSLNTLQAFTFTSNIGAAQASSFEKYNTLNRDGTYNKPTSFIANRTIDGSFLPNFIINGDFEADTANWTTILGSGFVTTTQSQVNNAGRYVWGSGTSGFTIEQIYDISGLSYPKYIEFQNEYSGWNSADTVQAKVSYLDASNVSTGTTEVTPLMTGNRADAFLINTQEMKIPTGTTQLVIDIEEVRNSGSDSDGYLDNLVIRIRPNKYYTSDNAEHIFIPTYHRTTYYYGENGNDLIEPVNIETWSERQRYGGNSGNDYIINPVGKLNYANGNGNDDVCIAYQGATLITKSRLNGGTGNDKLYAPVNGTLHTIKGNSGTDMAVLRGNKVDYTVTYDAANALYTFDNGTVIVDIYDDVEAVAFTNSNVLTATNGNTAGTEDIWAFDTATNTLTETFPTTLQDILRSVSSTPYPTTITNDIVGTFTLYINGLPNTIEKATDTSGNLIANSVTETNELGETKTYIRIPNLTGGQALDIILVDEQNSADAYVTPDFNTLNITRGF